MHSCNCLRRSPPPSKNWARTWQLPACAAGESLRTWAGRMGVSVPTLQRLEAGDPAVGIVATAPWLIRRDGELGNLAAPEHDQGAIELDVREAVKPEGAQASAEVRIGASRPKRCHAPKRLVPLLPGRDVQAVRLAKHHPRRAMKKAGLRRLCFDQIFSRKVFNVSDRDGCRSLFIAFASIWRMRSRVTSNCLPTSSSV
ncbi:hypothetical protein SAMN06295970_106123 [Noviherbaspirillum suwonense]|uniref:XRE family transcriptional regulator n=1 Tax=Noviherbaspirillum suwonense TaxID=1224511 RepID=A0ABY1Q4S2_9BURK|nr:hypothetical protein SAMN06295970_106123 [Noviherbaspirillum suwonense]